MGNLSTTTENIEILDDVEKHLEIINSLSDEEKKAVIEFIDSILLSKETS